MTKAGSEKHRKLVRINHKVTEKAINSDRHIEAIRQMRAKKGPVYERWKARWEAATGLKIEQTKEVGDGDNNRKHEIT